MVLFKERRKNDPWAEPGYASVYYYKSLAQTGKMINNQVIETLYKKYKKTPKSIDMLNLAILFDYAAKHHNIYIEPESKKMTIGSIDPSSPFHSIPVNRINAIVPFEEWVAVVTPASIIFLNRKNSQVSVHIKPVKPGLMDRIRQKLQN